MAKDTKEKEIRVTPEMLLTFAKNIRQLEPNITTAKKELAKINIKAGNFPDGTGFAKLVGLDPSGRATKYDKTLSNLKTAIEQLASGIESIAKTYTSTEELNKHLSEELTNVMANVGPTIGSAAPPTPTTTEEEDE